jgi:phosphatidate cytidylyltransferase
LLFSFAPFLTWKEALVYGIFIGSIGQIGDLAESLLKRDAQIKDSNAIPGLGGILDMVDSLLFTTPVLFFFL